MNRLAFVLGAAILVAPLAPQSSANASMIPSMSGDKLHGGAGDLQEVRDGHRHRHHHIWQRGRYRLHHHYYSYRRWYHNRWYYR